VKPHGKKAKGATKSRAAHGPRPDGHLTPKDAEAELRAILTRALPERAARRIQRTFGQACCRFVGYSTLSRGTLATAQLSSGDSGIDEACLQRFPKACRATGPSARRRGSTATPFFMAPPDGTARIGA
jgi:hypothetical protein